MSIIGTLPVSLQNGTLADATQVMSDFNFIVTAVNASAAALSGNNAFIGDQSITGNVTASGNVTGAAFIPTSTSVPANGLYLKAANNPALSSNTTLRWDVNSTGNHTFAVPTSGNTASFAALAGGAALPTTSTGAYTVLSFNDGTRIGVLTTNASLGTIWGTTSAHGASILTNNSSRLEVSSAGNVTANSPSSGNTFIPAQAPTTSLSINAGGPISVGPYASIPASIAGSWAFETPNTRFYVGDGTGYSYRFAKRVGSVTTDLVVVTDGGQLYGTALHNNAGSVTGTTNQQIASGTYTTTLTNSTNVASSTVSGTTAKWMRVGNVVTVSGFVQVTPTSGASAPTLLRISLPIASTWVENGNCNGTANQVNSVDPASIFADLGATTTATLQFTASSTAAHGYNYQYSYTVL
jgi:hypothetical protein